MPVKEVKALRAFPIPLGGMFKEWAEDGTLRTRLRAALAEAVEAESGEIVLVNSVLDKTISENLAEIFDLARQAGRKP